MIITGISAQQFGEAVEKLSAATYGDNLRVEVGRVYSGNRFAARVIPRDSGARMFGQKIKTSAPGARKSWSGRRINAACWHAYRDAILAVFDINPDARVYTTMAKYVGRDGFMDNYPRTADKNIGSLAQPAYMPELCDCEHFGIDTRESGAA